MGMTFDNLLEKIAPRPAVTADVRGVGVCHFRHPTVQEWHGITTEHQACGDRAAPLGLVCRTIALVLVDEDGKRIMTDDQARRLHDADPAAVMALYEASVKVAFSIKEDDVEAELKN